MARKLQIVDLTSGSHFSQPIKRNEIPTEKLSEQFGRELTTVERARRWLTNPANWFDSEMYILKWDGIVPTVCKRHGMRLVEETWDNDLPMLVVREQLKKKTDPNQDDESDRVQDEDH